MIWGVKRKNWGVNRISHWKRIISFKEIVTAKKLGLVSCISFFSLYLGHLILGRLTIN